VSFWPLRAARIGRQPRPVPSTATADRCAASIIFIASSAIRSLCLLGVGVQRGEDVARHARPPSLEQTLGDALASGEKIHHRRSVSHVATAWQRGSVPKEP